MSRQTMTGAGGRMKHTARSRGPKRPVSKTTALARRPRRLPAKIFYNPEPVSSGNGGVASTLTTDPIMVSTFIGTLNLKAKQIDALRRPVKDEEVEWRPLKDGGPPAIPYLSHNGYRDRLDAAFGLGGWGMVPVGQPKEKDSVIYMPFALVINGVPRIYAWGEQRYFETNREGERSQMTYGDALEGAKSNAIVRCGKELGIARELWDRKYIALLQVRVHSGERSRRQGESPRQQAERPPAGHHAHENEPITYEQPGPGRPPGGQVGRLWNIIKHSGRSQAEVKTWFKERYGLTSTKAIRRKDYDAICAAIEKPGPLLVVEPALEREPGEDDA